MAKITRDVVVTEALDLLDEVGLDAVSTRRLAQRLGVEQPSLYWHFRKKEDLIAAMAEAAMLPHASQPLPEPPTDWRDWFIENSRSFRTTLLLHRDGARLHAGLVPGENDLDRIRHKLRFMVESGVPERAALMASLAASRFTIGSVLEQQATPEPDPHPSNPDSFDTEGINHDSTFEEGLALIINGLALTTRSR